MGQRKAHSHQSHGRSYVSQVGNGCFDKARKLNAQDDNQQGGKCGYGSRIEHGFHGRQREFTIHQRNAIGIEDERINQQKFAYIDHIFLSKNAGDYRDADESQIGENEHHLEYFPLIRCFVKERRQKHSHKNEDDEHA